MKALTFVCLNVVNGVFTGAEYELYSGYWQAYLRKQGVCTQQYINTVPCTAAELADDIVRCSSGRIVFFVGEYNYYISKVIVNRIRQRHPETELIAAGPAVSYICEHLADDFPVDCYITENSYAQLLAAAQLPELTKETVLPSFSVRAEDIPHPYSAGVIPPREAVNTGLTASRGCVGKCSFCSYGTECMVFSPESVAAELRYLSKRLGGQHITLKFFDECFGISTEHAAALCRAIAAAHLPFTYFCWIRLDLLTDELLHLFAEAGFRSILVGLESASPRVLEGLGKLRRGDSAEAFLARLPERIAYAKSLGIKLMVSVNFGLDGEQTADAAETLRYVQAHHLEDVSVNYMTVFPKSRLYAKYAANPARCSESPTRLPFRTYYPDLNMRLIADSETAVTANAQLSFREDLLRGLAVDYYCNIHAHGESLLPRTNRFTTISDMQADDWLLLGESCLVRETDTLRRGRIYCDERKPLKYEIAEADADLKTAYEQNVYIENRMYLHKANGHCDILVNQSIGSGRFRFRHFGASLAEKTAFLTEQIRSVRDGCAELLYRELPELIFDDLGAFMANCAGKPSLCAERYAAEEVQAFYAAWNAEPLLPVYASAIVFLYKNKRLFDTGGSIRLYFHDRFRAFDLAEKPQIVLICVTGFSMLYDTRSKQMLLLKNGETAMLLDPPEPALSAYKSLGFRLKKLMGAGEAL